MTDEHGSNKGGSRKASWPTKGLTGGRRYVKRRNFPFQLVVHTRGQLRWPACVLCGARVRGRPQLGQTVALSLNSTSPYDALQLSYT